MNLVLKLFGYFREFMIVPEKLSTPQDYKNVAFVGIPRKISVGCLTMKSMTSLKEKRKVSVEVITEGSTTVFPDNHALYDSVYSVQREVHHMIKNQELKQILQDNMSPIPYWRCTNIIAHSDYDWFCEKVFLYEPTTQRCMYNVIRDNHNNCIHNHVAHLKANDGFQHGYCKVIIKMAKLTISENFHPGKNNESDILGRSYLNTQLYNTNEDYITNSLYLNTPVDKLPDDIDDRATTSDLKEDMVHFRYKISFSSSETDTVAMVVGGDSSLYHRYPLSDD
jgi:hypothetical protein